MLLCIATISFGQDKMISNVNVIDVANGKVLHNQDVTLKDGKIASIKKHSSKGSNQGFEVIDGTGKFLSPGFIDAHVHVAIGPVKVKVEDYKPLIYIDLQPEFAERTSNLLVAYGITTARDPGGLTEVTVSTKQAIENKQITGPALSVAGSILDTLAFKNLTSTVKSKEEIVAEIQRQKAAGVDWVKLYTSLSPELLEAGVAEAKRQGLRSVSHLHTTSWTEAARLGLDNIVHIIPGSSKLLPESNRAAYSKYEKLGAIAFYKWFELVDLDSPEITEMISALKKNKVSIDPTLVPFHAAFFGDQNIYQSNPNLDYMPESMLNNWKTSFNFNLGWQENDFKIAQQSWPKVERLVRMLHENGIMMTAGTDANNPWIVPGDSFHDELKLLVACGLSTAEVLKIATINGAKLIGWQKSVGQVKKGFEADLVLLGGNPLDNIENTRKIERVFLDGEEFEPKEILSALKK